MPSNTSASGNSGRGRSGSNASLGQQPRRLSTLGHIDEDDRSSSSAGASSAPDRPASSPGANSNSHGKSSYQQPPSSSAQRVFPIRSFVGSTGSQHPDSAAGTPNTPASPGHSAKGSSAEQPPSIASGPQSRPSAPHRSSYFGPSVRFQDHRPPGQEQGQGDSDSPGSTDQASTAQKHREAEQEEEEVQTPHTLDSTESNRYVDQLHQQQHEIHAEPDEDEIIRRARAAKHRHEANERMSESGSSVVSNLEQLMTVRFEHQETDDGHMIITGHEGQLQRCEDEPIHVPGAVQAWGVLLAVELTDDGRFLVMQASENVGHLLGLPASYLFKLSCFTQVLADDDEAAILRDSVENMPTTDADLQESGPAHFEMAGSGLPGTGLDGPQSRNEWLCWCTMHRPARAERPNLLILELELQDDMLNPPMTESGEPFTEDDRSGLAGNPYEPTESDLRESTINAAKPIRQPKSRRRAAAGQDYKGADVFHTFSQVSDQLSKAEDLPSFLKIVVGVMQDLTNYHRVMVYQFDEEWNGQVVAELVDWTKTRDLYRGLHFPAADIPAQARELYKLNRVRLLYDRDQPTARMVCRNRDELSKPLDMTHVALRAISPIHIKYLANMGVRASCSVSITAFGSLWGLISMHSYGRFGFRINSQQRQLCRILGDNISRNIERLSYAQRLHSRKLINTVSSKSNPSGYIVAKAEDLLTLFDAEFGCLSIGDEAKLLGTIENSQEVLAVLEYLRQKRFLTIQASQSIADDFEDLHYPAGFKVIAGLLLVPLSQSGRDFIAFFRRGQIKHIHWAGNPYDKIVSGDVGGRSKLEPRTSFKLWSETVLGRSTAWTDDQFETASVLALVYGKFIDVWRQKQVAMRSNELTSLLLSNASHEVRTPLNHIVGYLEMALDGPLDDETRENLTKSYSASKSLIHVINDLLDLTRAEEGNALFLQDPLDLHSVVEEAVYIYRDEAARNNIGFNVTCTTEKLPATFIGDRSRTKQIIANIVANATKHTSEGHIQVEWGQLENPEAVSVSPPEGSEIMMYFSIRDTGVGIPEEKLDHLFRQFEEVDSYDPQEDDAPAQSALGLGLAVVARLVRTLGGQLRVESTVGQGSHFTIILPFGTGSPSQSPAPSLRRTSSKGSAGSKASLRSGSSGQASEIDSLVEAISADHMNVNGNKNENAVVETARRGPQAGSMAPRGPSTPSDSNGPTTQAIRQRPPPDSPGSANVEGSQFPIRPLRVEQEMDSTTAWHRSRGSQPSSSQSAAPTSAAPPTPPETPSEGVPSNAPASDQGSSDTTWKPIPAEKPPTAPPKTKETLKLNVLVVEDDSINRAILQRKLVKDGHNVKTSVHGEDAVAKFESDASFDVILMDLQMPVCSGTEAAKRIRAIEKQGKRTDRKSHQLTGHIPIIAVSASLYEKQRPEMIECGMDGWILKPINFERLKVLLSGTVVADDRKGQLYRPGHFEKGGWFTDTVKKAS